MHRITVPLLTLVAIGIATPAQVIDDKVPSAAPSSADTSSGLTPLPGISPDSPAANDAQWQSLFDANDPGLQGFAPSQDPFGVSLFNQPSHFQGVVDPFQMLQEQMAEMQRLQTEMQHHFDRQFQSLRMPPGSAFNVQSFSMRGGDIRDCGDHYEISLQIEGLDKGTTDISVDGNQLALRCLQNREVSQTDPSGNAHSTARMSNHIERRWTLPMDVDRSGITADAQGDEMLITLPRLPDGAASRSIPIN